jgi:hypothetical protein
VDFVIKNYAIVENGVVVNIAVSEYPLADNWHESEAQIGWTYDGKEFHAPPPPPPPPVESEVV